MEKKVEGATGYQEKMETGDKETLEGQRLERKRKRNDGMNIVTRCARCIKFLATDCGYNMYVYRS